MQAMHDRYRHPACSVQTTSFAQRVRRRWVGIGLGRLLHRLDARLCAPGSLPVHGIHRILVCRINHRLGNNILVSPLLDELARLYPGAEVDIASAGESARELFANRFHVREVPCFSRRMIRHPWHTIGQVRDIRRTRYDLAIDPCVNSHSGRLLLGLCHARHKVGFPRADIDDRYRINRPLHMAKCGVFLLRTAFAGTHMDDWPPLHVLLEPHERQRGRDVLSRVFSGKDVDHRAASTPIIGIFAHATGNKRLPEAWWNQFVTALRERRPHLRLVNVLAHHGCSQLPGTVPPVYSSDLRKLASALAGMQGFISADCGVMHLAAAVGTPTLGLFTCSSRARYAPYGARNRGVDLADDGSVADAVCMAVGWLDQVTGPDAGADFPHQGDIHCSAVAWS